MKCYRVCIPPDVQDFLSHVHPKIKGKIRVALEELEKDPWLGKPLKKPLHGLYSYRVAQYRIVYRINRSEVTIEVIDISERVIVYQKVAALCLSLARKVGDC